MIIRSRYLTRLNRPRSVYSLFTFLGPYFELSNCKNAHTKPKPISMKLSEYISVVLMRPKITLKYELDNWEGLFQWLIFGRSVYSRAYGSLILNYRQVIEWGYALTCTWIYVIKEHPKCMKAMEIATSSWYESRFLLITSWWSPMYRDLCQVLVPLRVCISITIESAFL